MAVLFLLLFAFTFGPHKYSTFVAADSHDQINGVWDHGSLKPRHDAALIDRIEHETTAYQTGTGESILETKKKTPEVPKLQGRALHYGGVSYGAFNNKPQNFVWPLRARRSGRVEISNIDGLRVRASNLQNYQTIKLGNNNILMGGQVVCDDISKLENKVTYQKSPDGTYWHANIKVGKPMTQAEIEEFENDWVQHKADNPEKEVRLQAQPQHQETGETKCPHQLKGKKTQLHDEGNGEWLKQHESEREIYLKHQEEEAKKRQTEWAEWLANNHRKLLAKAAEKTANREKHYDEKLKIPSKPWEHERLQKQRGIGKELEDREPETEKQLLNQGRENQHKLIGKQLQSDTEQKDTAESKKPFKGLWAAREKRMKDLGTEEEEGPEEIEAEYEENHYDNADTDDDDETDDYKTHFTIGDNSYMVTGRNLQLNNHRVVRFQVTSPYEKQNILIKGNIVTVNNRVVCGDIRTLSNRQTYQMTDDGAEWYTNLRVGRPMTEDEIQQYHAEEEERQTELEEKRKQRVAERKQRQEARERQLAAIDEEEERAAKEIEAEKARIQEQKEAGKERIRREKELAKERIRKEKKEAKERLRKETQEAKEKVRQMEAAQRERLRKKTAALQIEKEMEEPDVDYDYD